MRYYAYSITIALIFNSILTASAIILDTTTLNEDYFKNVECDLIADPIHPCWKNNCARRVADGLFSQNDIDRLLNIANKGISTREDVGGPTIVDINTGYIRDSNGVINIFTQSNEVYTSDDFTHYGDIINRLKTHVMTTFNITDLYFTAPTFITKLDGRDLWQPQEIHDEYWHVHADMNNTRHYQYSGLLYLSTYGIDFDGGLLHFVSPTNFTYSEEIIHPKSGRVVIFTSGAENPHYVERVISGQRYVLAFWFTCDKRKQFQIFLDGKAHVLFSHQIKQKLNQKCSEL